jgi:hypothetical protein
MLVDVVLLRQLFSPLTSTTLTGSCSKFFLIS